MYELQGGILCLSCPQKDESIRRLVSELAAAQAERDRLAADAQRWANIRDTVIRLDAQTRPGLPMGDDDVEQVVLRVLQRVARRGPVVEWRTRIDVEEATVGAFALLVESDGWRLEVSDGTGDYWIVDSGEETGDAGKAACFAAYLKAAGL